MIKLKLPGYSLGLLYLLVKEAVGRAEVEALADKFSAFAGEIFVLLSRVRCAELYELEIEEELHSTLVTALDRADESATCPADQMMRERLVEILDHPEVALKEQPAETT